MSLYEELKNIDELTKVCNLELFSCPICFEQIEPGQGTILRDCLHAFCNKCCAQHIVHSTDVEIKCPYIDPDYSCASIMQVIYVILITSIF
jgi:RanBP-type and C3HC4-type zinc finger-containing protein 1